MPVSQVNSKRQRKENIQIFAACSTIIIIKDPEQFCSDTALLQSGYMLVKCMSLFTNECTCKTSEELGKKDQKITINFQCCYADQKNHRRNGAYLFSRFHKDKNPSLPASAQTSVLNLHGGNEWLLKPAENVPNHYFLDRKRSDGWHNTTHGLKLQQGDNH